MTDPASPPDSLTRRTAIGAVWMIGWRAVARGLGLISTLVLARILAPSDFGLLGMATAFSASVEAMSQIGLADALVRHSDDDRRLYDTAFTLGLARSLATGAVVAAAAPLAAAWFHEPRLSDVLLALAGITVMAGLENVGVVQFRRGLRYREQFLLLTVPRICQVAAGITTAILLRSYWALVVGLGTNRVVRLAMTYALHPHRPRLTLAGWRELAGFSFWSWASSLARIFWDRLDAFVLGPAIGPLRMGAYMLGTEMALLPVTELIEPAAGVLFPGFAAARNRGTDTVAMSLALVSTLLLAVVPLAIGISAGSDIVIAVLLGPHWEAAQPVIAVFAWVCVLSPFSYVGSVVLMAAGQVHRDFQVMAAASVVKLAVLSVTARTGNLVLIAAGGILCVAVEAGLFVTQLHRIGDPGLRRAVGAWARLALSAAVTIGVLRLTGVGWHAGVAAPLDALQRGGWIFLLTIASFFSTQGAVWWLAGRPDGPEWRLLDALRSVLPARAP